MLGREIRSGPVRDGNRRGPGAFYAALPVRRAASRGAGLASIFLAA